MLPCTFSAIGRRELRDTHERSCALGEMGTVPADALCRSGHDRLIERCVMVPDSHKTFCASGRRSGSKVAGGSANRVPDGGYDHGCGKRIARTENGQNVTRVEGVRRPANHVAGVKLRTTINGGSNAG